MKKFFITIGIIIIFVLYILYHKDSGQTNTQSTSNITYKDGTYTGTVADAYYGPLQVQAVITGGKITDVIFLQYPNDRPNSVMINSESNPRLKQEAIQTQSSNVNVVTGATQSSQAFVQSLASALQQAQ